MKRMKKGEVWRVQLPGGGGHAQAGKRPAVIVQDEPTTASLPTVLVIPFTGTMAAARFPGTVVVQPDSQNGLTVASVALVFQLTAIDKQSCQQRLGDLDAATLDQLFAELDKLTGR
jgi:mRNA-degrading endonuclease toxin of MazEF toxin-antitoxin module